MKYRMPRKLKKRINKQIKAGMAILNDPAIRQEMDDMFKSLFTYGIALKKINA